MKYVVIIIYGIVNLSCSQGSEYRSSGQNYDDTCLHYFDYSGAESNDYIFPLLFRALSDDFRPVYALKADGQGLYLSSERECSKELVHFDEAGRSTGLMLTQDSYLYVFNYEDGDFLNCNYIFENSEIAQEFNDSFSDIIINSGATEISMRGATVCPSFDFLLDLNDYVQRYKDN